MPAQLLAAPTTGLSRMSGSSQESAPGSPGRGMVWNTQATSPLRTLKAMISPGAPPGPSEIRSGMMIRSLKTVPGVLEITNLSAAEAGNPERRSTFPPVPKLSIGVPVRASSAHRSEPTVYRMRWSSPCSQKLTPRLVECQALSVSPKTQSSSPVRASRAKARRAAVTP